MCLGTSDHPQDNVTQGSGMEGAVVRYYRRPGMPGTAACPRCSCMYNDHGWVEHGDAGIPQMVCPGAWVVTYSDGTYGVADRSPDECKGGGG